MKHFRVSHGNQNKSQISTITCDDRAGRVGLLAGFSFTDRHHINTGLLGLKEKQEAPAIENRLDFADRLTVQAKHSASDMNAGFTRHGDADAIFVAFEELHPDRLTNFFFQISGAGLSAEHVTLIFLITRQSLGSSLSFFSGAGIYLRRKQT